MIPPPMAVPARAPVIPKEVKVANTEPAATFPIAAWVAAAAVPATTPAVPNPKRVVPSPKAVANPPTISYKLAF